MSQATLSHRPYTNSNLFSGHYLDERVQDREEWDCDEAARAAMDELEDLYELESDLVSGYAEDPLIDNWIDEVLDVLGFGTNVETTLPDGGGYVDALLFEDTESRRDAAEVYLSTEDTTDLFERGVGLVEAKQWDADFTTRFSEQRPYRNASHQIKHYLERTPENIQWGILTNGRKWRLYGTKDYETQTYYEVDLPELLEKGDLEAFKYFYAFFRPEAFREGSGSTFLDSVRSESETVAQELGEDLQDNVFTAVRVLGRGFVESNDLDIDPENDEALAELKEQSLVLLYRLMFVLYAESRGLIHPEGGDAVTEYEDNFSLDELRLEIHDEIGEVDDGFDEAYSEHSTTMWSRLEDLFRLVDEGEESLGIPPYNGGLFNREEHEFLTENEVSNRYLAEVIYRISTTENDEGRYVLADYADLDTRHLGSVYEGLLEHQFRIAPEAYAAVAEDGGQVWKPATEVSVADAVETVDEGGLYVVNDEGERKATGAYYTPDYVVTYIVEETVDPLIDEIREDLQEQGFEPGTHEYLGAFYRRVLDLKILDPAMGSGHFLTRATEYLAQQVMEEVRDIEEATAFDEQRVRRDVAKECIYGVDLNGMAVELAKLSMWLETLSADQPLAFLDHHLKAGNSLVGSDVTDVLSSDAEENGGQLTLQQALARVRQDTLEHVMERMQELLEIDNETLEDVKSMEEIYDEVRSDPFYQRLFELTNVHTAERFDLDVPEGAYERMARAIDDEDEWDDVREEDWFQTAQEMAGGEAFFHWELEYPEVFFDENGEKQEDAGFDAVIGNPPWVDVKGLRDPEVLFELFDTSFNRVNIYAAFIERSTTLLGPDSEFGFITPNSYLTQSSYQPLRKHILDNHSIETIVRLPDGIFSNVTMETAILLTQTGQNGIDTVDTIRFPRDVEIADIPEPVADVYETDVSWWRETDDLIFDIFTSDSERRVIQRIEATDVVIGDEFESCLGLTPYDKHQGHTEEQIENRVFHSDEKETDQHYPITTGEGINRYRLTWEGGEWIKYGDWLGSEREKRFFTKPRCVIRQIVSTEGRGIYAAYSDIELFHTQVGFVLLPKGDENAEERAKSLTAIINSKLMTFYHRKRFLDENKDTFQKILIQDAVDFPLPIGYHHPDLVENAEKMEQLVADYDSLNLDLLDHLGSYSEGQTLSDVGFSQPPEGAADSILTDTAEDRENLRVGTCEVIRESPTSLEIRLTARYKPEDEDEYETDQWGYTETEPLPALRISDLTETEADLIETFVPVAVDEAGGFADFRETATKTNSLVDRLRKLTLPAVDDVRDGLESYLETKARAEELEEKIEKTDELIDEIVYELYGLTDEEIEIVEEAVKE
ncbi:Eco57I restriction-modification methylase domain-containing protein [Natronobacterium texcoconense]|uniref:site-specific DNA-methyltransferase (adenine-specific) n=1 Tax=Natronobacterium texcoconense TaxID=1095778 RepID=A0A1H1CM02_NATTX|nr:N-6 DNA methylase [Natronobacterium texcoconense]SDQ65217.1 TaqI-like C-terminal specificity domain-containing protein [Natronobacterium texcoconense]